jgi:hypothetical protein
MEFAFLNVGEVLHRPAFGLRLLPESSSVHQWYVPSESGVQSGSFTAEPTRRYLRPEKPWAGLSFPHRFLTAHFPEGVLDAVEIGSERAGERCSVSPLVYYLGLNPGCEARLTGLLYWHEEEPASTEWMPFVSELNATYVPASPERTQKVESDREALSRVPERPPFEWHRSWNERAERLSGGQSDRLALLARLRKGEVTPDAVLQQWTVGPSEGE